MAHCSYTYETLFWGLRIANIKQEQTLILCLKFKVMKIHSARMVLGPSKSGIVGSHPAQSMLNMTAMLLCCTVLCK
jgi:hypothetical protein